MAQPQPSFPEHFLLDLIPGPCLTSSSNSPPEKPSTTATLESGTSRRRGQILTSETSREASRRFWKRQHPLREHDATSSFLFVWDTVVNVRSCCRPSVTLKDNTADTRELAESEVKGAQDLENLTGSARKHFSQTVFPY